MTVAVSGVGGALGAEISRRIRQTSRVELVGLTRNPGTTSPAAGNCSELRRADFRDRDGLIAALRGVRTLVLVSVEGDDADRVRLHRNAIDAAVAAGVDRLVYTSFLDVDPASPSHVARVHRLTEEYLRERARTWTILRNGPYLENSARRIAGAAARGTGCRMPAGRGRLPFISRSDLAAAAACAALDSAPGNRTHVLSGPESLTFADLTRLVAVATGQDVSYTEIDEQDYRTELAAEGVPDALVPRRLAYVQAIRAGYMDIRSGDFHTLTGRQPRRAADVLHGGLARALAPPAVPPRGHLS